MVVKFYTDNPNATIKLKEFLYERAKQTTNYERLEQSFSAYANTNELESVGIYTLESGASFEEFSRQRANSNEAKSNINEYTRRKSDTSADGRYSLSESRSNTRGDTSESEGDKRYSLKDNLGNQLTEEQAEFFKDSKVRDENGNLLVVYHGTDKAFFVFDNSKSLKSIIEGGLYFTTDEENAKDYATRQGNNIYR